MLIKPDGLVIPGALIKPPSESYAVRSFTFFAREYCNYDLFLKVPWDSRDSFWIFIKEHFIEEYIEELINEEEENPSKTWELGADVITCDNLHFILMSIGFNGKSLKNENTLF